MGEKIIREVGSETGRIGEQTTKSASSTDARTGRTGRTRASRGRRTRTAEEKERLFKLADVNEKSLESKEYAEKKEKYDKEIEQRKESKVAQNKPVKLEITPTGEIEEKPVKKTRKRRTKKNSVDTEPIEKLLMATTGIIATRPDMQMWKMSKQEAHAIAEPLGQVLEKYDLAKPLTENAPEIALIVATLTFVAPRTVATIAVKKERKKDGFKGKVVSIGSTGKTLDENRESKTVVQRDDKKSSTDVGLNDAFGSSL